MECGLVLVLCCLTVGDAWVYGGCMLTQGPDPQPGHYYVTAIDGPRRYFLAGPWPTHGEALAQVEAVRRYADAMDPRATWMAYGTARQPLGGEPIKSALGCDATAWQ